MSKYRVGCGTITWGSMDPKPDVDPLAEIAQAGYEGAPCGPREGESAAETLAKYAAVGLKPAPGYLGAEFWIPEKKQEILAQAQVLGKFMSDVGCTEVYVASNGFNTMTARGKTRRELSAHILPEDALTPAQYDQFAETLNEVGRITLSYGVKSCFHNHVGSFIETRQEIDDLFARIDPDLVFQGPDIGHLAWAGVDPVQFCKDYAASIVSVHLKDIYGDVYQKGLAAGWGYSEFSANGIFAELGEGIIDYPALFKVLDEADYEGWLIVETDRTTKATALESATICREYLKSLGI